MKVKQDRQPPVTSDHHQPVQMSLPSAGHAFLCQQKLSIRVFFSLPKPGPNICYPGAWGCLAVTKIFLSVLLPDSCPLLLTRPPQPRAPLCACSETRGICRRSASRMGLQETQTRARLSLAHLCKRVPSLTSNLSLDKAMQTGPGRQKAHILAIAATTESLSLAVFPLSRGFRLWGEPPFLD